MRIILSAAALGLMLVAVPQAQSPNQPRRSDFLERAFVANGRVTMDLSAGEYRVTGSRDNRIRLDWSVGDGARLSEVRARADVRGLEAAITTDGPDEGSVRGAIQVPARTDLYIRLTAGELTVEDVQGNKDIRLHAGEIRIDVGRPEDYQRVHAFVWAGDVNAEPFNVTKGGLFRSFEWNGQGRYRLRAQLKAGDIRLYSKTSN